MSFSIKAVELLINSKRFCKLAGNGGLPGRVWDLEHEEYLHEDDDLTPDYEQHMNSWIGDNLEDASWEDLFTLEQSLKDQIQEFEEEEQEPPFILMDKLDLVQEALNPKRV